MEEVAVEVEESKNEDDADDFMAAWRKKRQQRQKEREKLKEKLAASNHSHVEQQEKRQKQVLKKKEKADNLRRQDTSTIRGMQLPEDLANQMEGLMSDMMSENSDVDKVLGQIEAVAAASVGAGCRRH